MSEKFFSYLKKNKKKIILKINRSPCRTACIGRGRRRWGCPPRPWPPWRGPRCRRCTPGGRTCPGEPRTPWYYGKGKRHIELETSNILWVLPSQEPSNASLPMFGGGNRTNFFSYPGCLAFTYTIPFRDPWHIFATWRRSMGVFGLQTLVGRHQDSSPGPPAWESGV